MHLIAARQVPTAPLAAQGSGPTPSSNLAAARRRRRGASAAGLRSAQQWAAQPHPEPPRRGCSGCGAADAGARLQGAGSQQWGSGGCGGARQPRLPAAGAAREGRAGSPLATR